MPTRPWFFQDVYKRQAYQSADLVAAMEKDTGVPITSLKVDGGASRDQFLMQFQADILNKTVLRPAIREMTSYCESFRWTDSIIMKI